MTMVHSRYGSLPSGSNRVAVCPAFDITVLLGSGKTRTSQNMG